MREQWSDVAGELFDGLLARTHLSKPSDVAQVVAEEAQRSLSASGVIVYWVNRELTALIPITNHTSPHREAQDVEGSLAGRSFTSGNILATPDSDGGVRLFVPVMDGTDRVGIIELSMELAASDISEIPRGLLAVLERLGHATAMVLISKMVYGDSLELVQRSRAMDLGAELLWSVVPPLTFATDGLVISALLEPAYENGGDAFDYAANDDLIHLAVLDGVGHGLAAAGLSTFAIAAYRHSRRTGLKLADTYAAMDAAISEHFTDRFVTGVLAQLDPRTGFLRWVNAGHPPPLLLRDGRVVKVLESEPATPLGVPMFSTSATVAEEQLEPGDAIMLYTDGVTEARRPDGSFLEIEGLIEFLEREAAAKQSPPETLRRLRRSLFASEGTVLHDDATVLMMDWHRGSEKMLLPQTVFDQGDT